MVTAARLRREGPEKQSDRQSSSLAGLALMMMLVVSGVWLVDRLRDQASMQDCVLSGRTGCEIFLAR